MICIGLFIVRKIIKFVGNGKRVCAGVCVLSGYLIVVYILCLKHVTIIRHKSLYPSMHCHDCNHICFMFFSSPLSLSSGKWNIDIVGIKETETTSSHLSVASIFITVCLSYLFSLKLTVALRIRRIIIAEGHLALAERGKTTCWERKRTFHTHTHITTSTTCVRERAFPSLTLSVSVSVSLSVSVSQ